jgi:predicted permease
MDEPTAGQGAARGLRAAARFFAELRRDARHGLRMLAGSPGFTAVALVSLSLGICIATCAYSEINGLLRDVPGVSNPGQLVALQTPTSFPNYERFREMNDLFSDGFAYVAPVPFGIWLNGRTERTWGHLVTASYFSALGAHPLLGRFFEAEDDQPGRAPRVVLSYQFWADRLGSDAAVLGKTIRINGQPCMVIGVGRKDFRGASPGLFPADVWLPVTVDARVAPEMSSGALERRDLTMFQVVLRLRPGVAEARAQAALNARAQELAEYYGDADRDRKEPRVALVSGGKTMPMRKQDIPFFRQFLMVLGGLLLLIACANVANMMLARATDRRKEVAVRLSLGASRGRLVRQLLTESMLLAAGAAPLAFVLCVWVMHGLSQLRMPQPIPIRFDLSPDWRAAAFTFALTCLTGLAFGLAPALQATRPDLVRTLKEGGAMRLRKRRSLSLRNALMLCQMAASLTLLLLTGYLGLGIQNTLGVQEGFDPRNLYLASLDPVRDGYTPARAADFFDKLLDRLRRDRGIQAACITDTLPASLDGNAGARFSVPGWHSTGAQDADWGRKHIVGRDYFETAGIKIVTGRGVDRRDEQEGAAAVIVSQEAVRRFWKGEDPIGRRVEIANAEAAGTIGIWPRTIDYRSSMLGNASRTFEVVGVAHDVSEDLVTGKKHPAVYFPLRPSDYAQPSLRGVTLMLRAAPSVDAITVAEHEIAALDPAVTPFNASSMTEHIAQFMSMLKAASWTYGLMGLFGLALASVGLAGMTAYSVARRRHEIGIRMALGAQKRSVLAMIMKEGAILVMVGTLAGLALALPAIRAMSAMFFTVASIQGYDPILLVGAPLLLAGIAMAACYIPALRSTRIDPAVTLRAE